MKKFIFIIQIIIILSNYDFFIDETDSFKDLFIRKISENEIYIGKEDFLGVYDLENKNYISTLNDIDFLIKGSIYPIILKSSNEEIKNIISFKKSENNVIRIYNNQNNNFIDIKISDDESENHLISLIPFNLNFFLVYYFEKENDENKNVFKICSTSNCVDLSSSVEKPLNPLLLLDFSNEGLGYKFYDQNFALTNEGTFNEEIYKSKKGYFQNIEIENKQIITCFINDNDNNITFKVYCFVGNYNSDTYIIEKNPELILENCKYSSFSFYKLNSEKLIIGCFTNENKLILKNIDSSLNNYEITIENKDENTLKYSDFIVLQEDNIISIFIKEKESIFNYYGINYIFPTFSTTSNSELSFIDFNNEITLLSLPSKGNLKKIEECQINQNYFLNELTYQTSNSNTIDYFSIEFLNPFEINFDNNIIIIYSIIDFKIVICHNFCSSCEKVGDINNENCNSCIDNYFNNPYIKGKCFPVCNSGNYFFPDYNSITCLRKGMKITCNDNKKFIEANRQCVDSCDEKNCLFCQKYKLYEYLNKCLLSCTKSTKIDSTRKKCIDKSIIEENIEENIEEENKEEENIEEENKEEENKEEENKEEEENNDYYNDNNNPNYNNYDDNEEISVLSKPIKDENNNIHVNSDLSLTSIISNLPNILSECQNNFNSDSNNDKIVSIESDDYTLDYYPSNLTQTQRKQSKITNVDLGECENVLRKEYKIPDSENLFIAQLDNEKSKINNYNKYQFDVYDSRQNKLDLKHCEDKNIIINTPLDNPEIAELAKEMKDKFDIDIYNKDEEVFNSKCTKLNINGKDLILKNRVEDIYQNNEICNDCSARTDFENNVIQCNCVAKENKGIQGPDAPKKENINSLLDSEYLNMVSDFFIKSNIHLFKCYKVFWKFKDYLKNVGGIISFSVSIFELVLGGYFIFKQINNIFSQIFRNLSCNPPINNNNNINQNSNYYNMDSKNSTDEEIDNKLNEKEENKNENNKNNNLIIDENIKNNDNKINENNNNNLIIEENNKENSIDKSNNKIYKENLNDTKLHFKKKKDSTKNLKNNEKLINENEKKDISSLKTLENKEEEFSKEELNELSDFEDIKTYDKRNFGQYLISIIIEKQIFFSTIFKTSLFYPLSLRLLIFCFTILIFFFLNGLFYTEEYIENRYKTNKKLNYAYILKKELTKSIYASIFVIIIGKCLNIFTSNSINYTKIQKKNHDKKYMIQMKNLIFSLKKKFIILIILIIILSFSFFYFLFIFCYIFENNQIWWIVSTFISIIINFIVPIIFCFIITVIRFISLKINSLILLNISLCIYSII